MTESIGWFAAVVLLTTIGRQVYTQWRDGSSKGLSRWLFIGQITASIAFIVYSWLLGNWVFVVTNALMLVTAILGQWVYLTNRQQAAADSAGKEFLYAAHPVLAPRNTDSRDHPALPGPRGVMVATVAAIDRLVEPAGSSAAEEITPATVAVPADDDAPSTWDIKAAFQGGMFFLMLLGACYAAAEIILPIVVAVALMLVLQPAMRLLERLYLPRGLAALVIILILLGALAGLGTVLSGPAANWAQKLPEGIPKLQERLSFLSEPVASLQKLLNRAEELAPGAEAKPLPVKVEGTGLSERLLNGTRSAVSGLLETVLVLFFLLISGDVFLRRLVEILPRFKNKRLVVDISKHIENDISAYLATITIMNAAVGVATGTVVALTGLGDPVLWGTVAFLLNYVPILGPMIGVVIFSLAGLLSIETLWMAFLPAGLYLGIHMIEGETVTPMLLARRFTINPVLVIVALVFWYWMWGVPGAILATPMLAVTKIICDRIEALSALGHFIER